MAILEGKRRRVGCMLLEWGGEEEEDDGEVCGCEVATWREIKEGWSELPRGVRLKRGGVSWLDGR